MFFRRLLLILVVTFFMINCGTAPLPTSDNPSIQLTAFFDLRDRHSFLQVTNVTPGDINCRVHIQKVLK